MPREIQREAFYRYRPSSAYTDIFTRRENPALRALCQAHGGGDSRPSQAWLRGAGRFTDEFENVAHTALSAGSVKMCLYIDDPWKLTGYTRDELSDGTFQAAWQQTRRVTNRTAAERITNVMGIVERQGMMTSTQLDAAKWADIKLSGSRRFSTTWASFIFGHYARAWGDEDLTWLLASGATPQELWAVVNGLLGVDNGIRVPSGGLDFALIRLVLSEGVAVEYAREVLIEWS